MKAPIHHDRATQLRRRVRWWAAKIKVEPTQIRIQKMTRKWASCSTAGWVTFSEELLAQSKSFQKYVVVHELLHLQVPNHGKLFKSLLSSYLRQSVKCNCGIGRSCSAILPK